jgi:hypothetical protein
MRFARPACVVIFACLAGCQSTPSEKWGAFSIVYAQTNRTMASLADQGYVGLEAAERYEQVRAPVGIALDVTHAQLIGGNADAAKSSLERIADGLDQMQAVVKGVK